MNDLSTISKKERRELKREEREAQISAERRKTKFKKISKWVLVYLVVAGLVYGAFYFYRRFNPPSPDFSQAFPILDRSHVQQGTAVLDYNSNPPTSGKHWPEPTSRGVHDEEIPDEVLVHNLEHGEVWVSYRTGLPPEVIGELKNITGSFSKVVLTPRSKNDTDIALAAWGRLDQFNLPFDKERVEGFIKRYRNKGPELVP